MKTTFAQCAPSRTWDRLQAIQITWQATQRHRERAEVFTCAAPANCRRPEVEASHNPVPPSLDASTGNRLHTFCDRAPRSNCQSR
jgi:hypothetical protein